MSIRDLPEELDDEGYKEKHRRFVLNPQNSWLRYYDDKLAKGGNKAVKAVFFFACFFLAYLLVQSAHQSDCSYQSGCKNRSSVTDFTYGTILAGRNSDKAYNDLDLIRYNSVENSPDSNIRGLRVCIFTAEFGGIFPSGGIGYVLAELANLLASQKAYVTVAYLGSGKLDETLAKDLRERGVLFIKLPEPDIEVAPNHISLVGSYKALLYLRDKHNHFDIIHFNDYLGHAIYPLFAKRQGWLLEKTTVVVTLHGTTMWSRLANKQFPQTLDDISVNWIEREAISAADVIWAPSKFIATSLISEGVILPENVVILKNAPPTLEHINSKHEESFDGKTKRNMPFTNEIVFFGRLEMRKGPLLLIDALVALSKKHPTILKHIKISFLGRDTPVDKWHPSYKEKIRQDFLSSKHLMNLNLSFLDNFDREQAISYISNPHRLIIIPSMTENLPGTVYESIEFGANFIAADVGGIKEMIHPDDSDRCLFKPLPLNLATKLYDKISETYKDFKPVRHSETPTSIRSDIIAFHKQIHQPSSQYQSPSQFFLRRSSKFNPKITICLTHYNRPEGLLAVLKKWKNQDYRNYDVIVVDDESSQEVQNKLDKLVMPFMRKSGWTLLRVKHGYLGAARNRCVEAATQDTDFFFFTDDDDFVSNNALQSLADVAHHARADIVSAFYHLFRASTLEEAVAKKTESVWMFSGGSPAMGTLSNPFGGTLMLVSVTAFQKIGGFSEFDTVGCEDWEFYMRATAKGLRVEVVPNPDLLYIQKKEVSMSTTMDLKLCSYRAMSPVLSRYPPLADTFLMLRGLVDSVAEKNDEELQWSSRRYIGRQTSNGWEYGYCAHDLGKKVTFSNCHFQHLPDYNKDEARYEMNSLTGTSWPFVGRFGMHPSVSILDDSDKSITVLRRFKSNIVGDMKLKLSIHHGMPCGDGVLAQLYFGSTMLWGPMHVLPNSDPLEWTSNKFKIQPEDSILLMISPLSNDGCDSILVELDLYAEEELYY
uniref:Glycosyltransferase 2-like domain-containing protein n=1 Tax=Ditylum brightwellii TaxID=49249 RepID=A0A7S1Z8H6_9STRA